jgi:hypothetical protein
MVQGQSQGRGKTLSKKITKEKEKDCGSSVSGEHLPSKQKALNSNPTTASTPRPQNKSANPTSSLTRWLAGMFHPQRLWHHLSPCAQEGLSAAGTNNCYNTWYQSTGGLQHHKTIIILNKQTELRYWSHRIEQDKFTVFMELKFYLQRKDMQINSRCYEGK